jgi:hypothetical protein
MKPALTVFLAALAALLTPPGRAAAEPRPNVLLVVVDDLRFDDFGAAGHPFARTPHLDRVAREGAQFRDFFAVTPLCSPSRANILTGLATRRHGILDNTERSPLSHRLPTFARTLQAAGYHTGFIGKWHMGNDPTPRPGFDYWVALPGQGEVADPELFEDGRLARAPGYVTDIFTDRALAFITRARSAPFLLMLSHKALHPNKVQAADGTSRPIGEGGFIPAPRHRALYADATPARRGSYAVPPRGKPALERPIPGLKPLGPDTVTPDETIRDRLRMLASVDEGLGRLLAALEERGALDRTVVMVVGDNGYFYGEHGLSEERRLAYEESIRLPGAGWLGAHHGRGADYLGTRRRPAAARDRRTLAGPLVHGRAGGLAALVPDRVQHRHRLPADAADGLRRRAHRAPQVNPLPRARGDERTVRPPARPLRADEPHRPAGRRGRAPRVGGRAGPPGRAPVGGSVALPDRGPGPVALVALTAAPFMRPYA